MLDEFKLSFKLKKSSEKKTKKHLSVLGVKVLIATGA